MMQVPTMFHDEEAIGRLDKALHAFVGRASTSSAPQFAGPLSGWAVAIKDNIDITGEIVSVGSPMFADRRATCTAQAVRRLQAAGATIAGRTHMVELAFGGWGINTALGSPRNPWDGRVARLAGGSSSGAAVAVAARMARAALGSDSAGSIRMPAALCGITGLKPSFGLIPCDGVYPLAPSYDSVGPMAQSAEDCALLFSVLAGMPLGSDEIPVGWSTVWRMAMLDREAYPVPVEPAVQSALEVAAAVFEQLGVLLRPCGAPFQLSELTRDAGILIASEALAVHGDRFNADPQMFGAELRRRLEQACDTAASTVQAAASARRRDSKLFNTWLGAEDTLLLPTVHCTAPAVGSVDERSTPLGQFTRWVNHVGGCALSLPAGFDAQGLPVAIQLVGRAGTEARLLALGRAFQAVTDWHRRVPDLAWIAKD
jgi:aspartyl-tRNA(Asn)/glutamyl-tRNA(Gln) amidotransferase subunit A